jgi:hypothetical protein
MEAAVLLAPLSQLPRVKDEIGGRDVKMINVRVDPVRFACAE